MSKFIAFTIEDTGENGSGPRRVVAAYVFEEKRDEAFEADKNKANYRKGEVIVDKEKRKAEALAKLDGIDRLVLGLSHSSNCTNGFRD